MGCAGWTLVDQWGHAFTLGPLGFSHFLLLETPGTHPAQFFIYTGTGHSKEVELPTPASLNWRNTV
jgi:hypothetical protein